MYVIDWRAAHKDRTDRERVTVDARDFNSLSMLAREHHEKRLHEAAMERLAHEIRGSAKRRPRVRLSIAFMLKQCHRAGQRRLEA